MVVIALPWEEVVTLSKQWRSFMEPLMIGKRKVWFSLVLIVVFLGFTGSGVQSAKPEKKQYENLELIAKVLHFVETNYVEEVEEKELIYGAINGIMGKLDPHSSFLNPETFRDMKIETSGKFGGIGIEITVNDKGELTIVSPIDDTQAYKAGLKSGDYIIQIEDKSTKDMPLIEAVNMMRGKPGTIVRIKIFREGFDRPRDFKIRRAIIKVKSVKYQVLEQGYGYLKLSTFQETTAKEAQKAIKD